jgi:hypothetical protein
MLQLPFPPAFFLKLPPPGTSLKTSTAEKPLLKVSGCVCHAQNRKSEGLKEGLKEGMKDNVLIMKLMKTMNTFS